MNKKDGVIYTYGSILIKLNFMKYIVIFLAICHSLHSQISGNVEYSYRVMHLVDYETRSVLNFNSDESSYITLNVADRNDSLPKLISVEGNTINMLWRRDSRNKPIYFVDKKDNVLITKIRKFKENYILNEVIPDINWDIKSEFKTLSTFHCQKAVGYFRGRTYTAWFTESIPVSIGPWKLQGLPGLILEAKDDSDRYYYRATKIRLNTNDRIDLPELSASMPLKTFITEIVPKKTKEINKRLQAKSDRSITISSSVGIDRSSLQEVLYEWEEGEDKSKN